MLETQRLVMRPFTPADANALFRILGDTEVMRFSVGGAHRALADTTQWIEHSIRHRAEHGFAMFAILCKGTGDIIGKCGLEKLPDGRTEIGYRMHRDEWDRGYATEAGLAWLDHGFSVLKLSRVVAMIEEANHRSIRVAEKIGMQAGAREVYHNIPVIAYFAHRPAKHDVAS